MAKVKLVRGDVKRAQREAIESLNNEREQFNHFQWDDITNNNQPPKRNRYYSYKANDILIKIGMVAVVIAVIIILTYIF